MDEIIDKRFERVEKALATLITSISTYNPAPALANDLLSADTELSQGLDICKVFPPLSLSYTDRSTQYQGINPIIPRFSHYALPPANSILRFAKPSTSSPKPAVSLSQPPLPTTRPTQIQSHTPNYSPMPAGSANSPSRPTTESQRYKPTGRPLRRKANPKHKQMVPRRRLQRQTESLPKRI